ncbi:MAG: SRPBCC domain-containing protein [Pseudomonadota bacterium]
MTQTKDATADTQGHTQDVELIRDYKVSVDRLWVALTDPAEVAQWFGPEGVDIVECDMTFAQRGPWFCKMVGRESGKTFHVSGEITHIRPPRGGTEASTGFTWAWHDNDTGARGAESHVIFEVSHHGNGARFRLIHRDLPSVDAAQQHTQGWLSTLRKFDDFITT